MKKIVLLAFVSMSMISFSQDTDLDGLSDSDEINGTFGYTSDPNLIDTDSDGLTDFNEVMGMGNPQNYISNPNLMDSDGDGLTDLDEVFASFTFYSNPLLSDTDSDGLTDYEESTSNNPSNYYSNPNFIDSDNDGLTDYDEVMGINAFGYTSDPLDVDTDNGTVEDGDEVADGLDPNNASDDVCYNETVNPVSDLANLPDITGDCIVTSLTAPTATDNCSGAITGAHNVSLPITQVGTTVVTWTYEDERGNKTTQDQNVIVNTIPLTESVTLINDITMVADLSGVDYVWINCSDSLPIPGATNQQYTATANGSYAVIVIDGACRDTSDCLLIDKVSLDENSAIVNVTVYPNPSKDGKFSINYNGIINSIKLFDLTGKEMRISANQLSEKQIDCSHLEAGNYIIQMEISTGMVSKELVIRR